MARVSSMGKWLLAGIMAITLMFAGIAAVAPSKAYAANLAAGGAVIEDSMSTPTVSYALSKKAGALTVTLGTAPYSDIQGYEYRVALNSAFTKGVKTLNRTGTTATFKGLKAGKKYYAQARWFSTYNGTKHYSKWSNIKSAKVAIKSKNSKIKGVWKITGSNMESLKSTIKHNKRVSSSAKATLTFKTNGTIILTDYDKKKYSLNSSWGKWVALSKTVGQVAYSDTVVGTIKVKGTKLTLKSGKNKIYCKKI